MKFKGEFEISYPNPQILLIPEFEAVDEWDAQTKVLSKFKRKLKDTNPLEVRILLSEVVIQIEKVNPVLVGQVALF